MKKLIRILNTLWMSAVLLSTLSVYSMEKDYQQLAKQSEEYNESICLLTNLSKETLIEVFSYCLVEDENQAKSLIHSIQNFMKLNTVCKSFNTLLTLETIGALCKNYDTISKKEVLNRLMGKAHVYCRRTYQLPFIALVYAGACLGQESSSLLCYSQNALIRKAIKDQDRRLLLALFKHGMHPNQPYGNYPLFFTAPTVKIAQMFIDHGANVHHEVNTFHNVLWYIIWDEQISPKLIPFYLNYGTDARKLNETGSCILHRMAYCNDSHHLNPHNLLKKAALLLDAIPDMVNTINQHGETPIDLAIKTIKTEQKYVTMYIDYEDISPVFEKLIALFRKHGGLTAQELKQQAALLKK